MNQEQDTLQEGFFTTSVRAALNWGRKYSLFQYPFVTACCGMEYMSVSCAHHDVARFGAEVPSLPKASDLLWVVGTITHKNAPVLKRSMIKCGAKVGYRIWCVCLGGFMTIMPPCLDRSHNPG